MAARDEPPIRVLYRFLRVYFTLYKRRLLRVYFSQDKVIGRSIAELLVAHSSATCGVLGNARLNGRAVHVVLPTTFAFSLQHITTDRVAFACYGPRRLISPMV